MCVSMSHLASWLDVSVAGPASVYRPATPTHQLANSVTRIICPRSHCITCRLITYGPTSPRTLLVTTPASQGLAAFTIEYSPPLPDLTRIQDVPLPYWHELAVHLGRIPLAPQPGFWFRMSSHENSYPQNPDTGFQSQCSANDGLICAMPGGRTLPGCADRTHSTVHLVFSEKTQRRSSSC
ncbi:hypothetical protein BC826DRAFT_584559 [Russula brevipes]|nr:hypothetical protein BC826DRAFT_584559 [Russula brevipes]